MSSQGGLNYTKIGLAHSDGNSSKETPRKAWKRQPEGQQVSGSAVQRVRQDLKEIGWTWVDWNSVESAEGMTFTFEQIPCSDKLRTWAKGFLALTQEHTKTLEVGAINMLPKENDLLKS